MAICSEKMQDLSGPCKAHTCASCEAQGHAAGEDGCDVQAVDGERRKVSNTVQRRLDDGDIEAIVQDGVGRRHQRILHYQMKIPGDYLW